MMEKLPPEIAFEIFYRLPLESIVVCKLVCKSWRNLLPRGDDGNYFANMHLHRRRHHQQRNLDYYSTLNSISLREFRDDQKEEGSVVGEFHITEYNEVEGLNSKVKRLVFTQICLHISGWRSITRLVGSCNGLLCFTTTYHDGGGATLKETRIVICNPLLHEYVTLPLKFTYDAATVITGFGHNPITDEYKVVRVSYLQFPYDIGDVEVYTLGNKSCSNGTGTGAGMWRRKGAIRYGLVRNWSPVHINGSIHWLAKTGGSDEQNIIVSFNLEDEEFRVIPLPSGLNIITKNKSGLNITNTSSIGQPVELRGCLCLIEETRDTWDLNRNLDIWVLKDYMNKESWVKEFSIKWKGEPWSSYSPCAIIKKMKKMKKKKKKKKKDGDDDDDDDDDDEILCWCKEFSNSTKTLVSYDPKTQNFEPKFVYVATFDREPGFLYSNSLVSLKAL